MGAEQELNPNQYFLTELALFHHQPQHGDHSLVHDILERWGISLRFDKGAFNPETPGEYDPEYHRRIIQARQNEFRHLGLHTELGKRMADHCHIIGTGFRNLEQIVFKAIQELPINWRAPLSEKPPVFGTEAFNRFARHPMIQRIILHSLNMEEYVRASDRETDLRTRVQNPFIKTVHDFTQVARQVLESWFIQYGLGIPDLQEIEAEYEVVKTRAVPGQEALVLVTDDIVEILKKPERAENVFRKTNSTWQIRFRDSDIFKLADIDGLFYLSVLLRKPGRSVKTEGMYYAAKDRKLKVTEWIRTTMDEDPSMDAGGISTYDNKVEREKTTPEEREEKIKKKKPFVLLDNKARTEYEARLEKLKAARDEATRLDDEKRLESIDKETDAIEKELKRATWSRQDKGSTKERHNRFRDVLRAVDRTINNIREFDEDLAKHLKAHVKIKVYESCYGADLADPPDWTF